MDGTLPNVSPLPGQTESAVCLYIQEKVAHIHVIRDELEDGDGRDVLRQLVHVCGVRNVPTEREARTAHS